MAYGGLRGGIAFSLTKLTSIQLVPQVKIHVTATMNKTVFLDQCHVMFMSGRDIFHIVRARCFYWTYR